MHEEADNWVREEVLSRPINNRWESRLMQSLREHDGVEVGAVGGYEDETAVLAERTQMCERPLDR